MGSSNRLDIAAGTWPILRAGDFNIIRNSGHYGIGYDKGANPQIAVNNRGQVVRSRCARKSENDLVDGGLEISTEPQSGCPIDGKPTGSVSQAADSVCHPKIESHTFF
jgi:hypothetical protein